LRRLEPGGFCRRALFHLFALNRFGARAAGKTWHAWNVMDTSPDVRNTPAQHITTPKRERV
jgi:hypothetical protein